MRMSGKSAAKMAARRLLIGVLRELPGGIKGGERERDTGKERRGDQTSLDWHRKDFYTK